MNLSGVAQQQLLLRHGGGYGDMLAQRGGARAATAGQTDSGEVTRESLHSATKEFESIFVYQMVSAMRRTVGDGGLIRKSNAEQIFEGMLDEEWSRKMAGRHGSRGLAALLYRQLSRQMGLDEDGPAEAGESPAPGLVLPPAVRQMTDSVWAGARDTAPAAQVQDLLRALAAQARVPAAVQASIDEATTAEGAEE